MKNVEKEDTLDLEACNTRIGVGTTVSEDPFNSPNILSGTKVTAHSSGRVMSFTAPPIRKTRADREAEHKLKKEARRKQTWCCKCKMCWITFLVLSIFMIYYNYVIRMQIYQNRMVFIGKEINKQST